MSRPAFLQGHELRHRAGGQGRFEMLEFLQIGFGLLEVGLQAGFLLRVWWPAGYRL